MSDEFSHAQLVRTRRAWVRLVCLPPVRGAYCKFE